MEQGAADYPYKASVCIIHLCLIYHENRKISSQAGHIAQAMSLDDISIKSNDL